jgi:hypothetical protein
MFYRQAEGYTALLPLHGTIVPKVYGVYQTFIPDRELKEDRTVFVLVREVIQGRSLQDLKTWEAKYYGPKWRPEIEAAVAAVNSMDVYFWGGLEMLLRVTEKDEVKFGDICGWQIDTGNADELKKRQQEALEWVLMACHLMPRHGLPKARDSRKSKEPTGVRVKVSSE